MATHRHDHHQARGPLGAEWEGRRSRRFFRSGELPLVLLAMVAQRPQHGYDLMHELEQTFGPVYTPSPGSIYPALSALETEGLIEGEVDGDRKVYTVTEVGRQALGHRERLLAEVEARTGVRLSGGALEPALSRLVERVRSVASRVDTTEVSRILDETGDRVEALADQRTGKETGP